MKKLFFKNARIVDGNGSPAIENGILVLDRMDCPEDKGSICYAGEASACPIQVEDGDTVVDATGYTLLPGLFNTHVHLWQTAQRYPFKCDPFGIPYRTLIYGRHMAEALMVGVTTIRSVGGSDDIDLAIRKAINKGMIWGPRLITCGPPILPHGGHCFKTWGSVECSGPDEFVRAIRTEISKGVDQIKLFYSGGASGGESESMYAKHITDREGKAACEVAHMLGKRVVAHLSNDLAVRAAVECGVDSVEHAYAMTEDTAKMLKEKGVFYTPTLAATSIKYSSTWTKNLSREVVERLTTTRAMHLQSCGYAIQNGVTICCGTDTLPSDQFDGTYSTNFEMELLVEAGMTPLQAIQAATGNSADLCELTNVTGRLEAGLAGDVIAVKGCPDQNIKDMRNLSMVIRDCRVAWSNLDGFKAPKTLLPPSIEIPEVCGASNPW